MRRCFLSYGIPGVLFCFLLFLVFISNEFRGDVWLMWLVSVEYDDGKMLLTMSSARYRTFRDSVSLSTAMRSSRFRVWDSVPMMPVHVGELPFFN